MSIWKDIENWEHSAVAWFEKQWTKVHAEAPGIVDLVDRTLPYASLMLQTVVGLEGGPAAASEVGSVISQAQKDLDVANAVIYDTGATPTAASAITAVQSNLSDILNVSKVKNPNSLSTIAKVVFELGVLASALGKSTSAPAQPNLPDVGK